MEVVVLAIQARILLWVALASLATGIYLELGWLTIAWRSAVCAAVAMWACGWLLRQVARVIDERMAADLAEEQQAAEKAAQAPAPAKPLPGRNPAPARA